MPSRSNRRAHNGKSTYKETPDWGTAFVRPDNTPPQPQATGQGVLSTQAMREIKEAGGNFQIALWTKDAEGQTLRSRDGTPRIRIHIEPPYDNPDDDGPDEDEDDDVPF